MTLIAFSLEKNDIEQLFNIFENLNYLREMKGHRE